VPPSGNSELHDALRRVVVTQVGGVRQYPIVVAITSTSSASLSAFRPVASTAMPISASFVAQPKPIPPLAPVTIATCISLVRFHQRRLDLVLEYFARVVFREDIPKNHLLGRFELGNA